MPDLALYTVNDLRNWLLHNQFKKGLSNRIISPARAWAIINNPHVQDEDPVLATLSTDSEIAAFTTAFPEMIDGTRKWWFSSLWCAPEYRGHGYGLIVIGSLAEEYGIGNCLDRWGAPDTVGIFSYLGLKTIYTPRFVFGSRINRDTLKGKVVYMARTVQKGFMGLFDKTAGKEDYTLRYLPYIDDETYSFIQTHQNSDFFFHSQAFLNWVLQYSFTISAPLVKRSVTPALYFQSEIVNTQMFAVQVLDNNRIIGFYMMKHNDSCIHLLFLYYDDKAKNKVFASIIDHLKSIRIEQFDTENAELADYIRHYHTFPKHKTVSISFSCPESFSTPTDKTMQFGDGDCFAILS